MVMPDAVIFISSQVPEFGWITATIPKTGNKTSENEDASVFSKNGSRFAISDGATEGWESGAWAKQLARAFVACPPTVSNFEEWLAKEQQRWTNHEAKASAAWYVEEKQSQGSFATLVGLEIGRSKKMSGWMWRTHAVGDSCLFHVNGGQIKVAFPITNVLEFDNLPSLVPSSSACQCPELLCRTGTAELGDLLLLTTDAVAANLLALEDRPGLDLFLNAVRESIRSGDKAQLVKNLRAFQSVKNDDMTLTAISFHESPKQPGS